MKKISFRTTLLIIGTIPVVLAIVVLMVISMTSMDKALTNGVYEKLDSASESLAEHYEELIVDGELAYDESYVDCLKSQNIELTVFKGDERVMTSIFKDGTSTRNIGTLADATIYNKVRHGETVHESGVMIGGNPYYVAYKPIYDSNNQFWGMAFAGTPSEEVESTVTKSRNNLLFLSAVILIICAVAIFFISNGIKKPMIKSVDALKELADGHISNALDKPKSKIKEVSNIVDMAHSLQKALNEAIASVKESANQMNVAVIEVDDKTSDNVTAITQINGAIGDVSETSQAVSISANDLAKKSIELGDNVKVMVDNIKILKDNAEVIKSANEESAEYIGIMMGSSEESVRAIESITEEISNTDNAVNEITKVLDILEDIASETKLLSLNASIEASRAGEFGKGFAVVATEIRDLANSSNENVERIAQIIEKIVNLSNHSVKSAERMTEIIKAEQKYIADTQKKFVELSNGVDASVKGINVLNDMTSKLEEIQRDVSDSTTSLSAISEELGASAEEVSASCNNVSEACQNTMARTQEMRAINSILENSVSYFD